MKKTRAIQILLLFCLNCSIFAEKFDPFANFSPDLTKNDQKSTKNQDESPIIPEIQFEDENITLALQIISDATGWSIFPTEKASKIKISLYAKQLTARQVLDGIIQTASLISHTDGKIITVMTYQEYAELFGLQKHVIFLEHIQPQSAAAVLNPFLTQHGKIMVHDRTRSIVLYDTKPNLENILAIIEKIDRPAKDSVIELLSLEYANAEQISKTLNEIFAGKTENQQTENVVQDRVNIFSVKGSNHIIVRGRKTDVQKVLDMLQKLDVYKDDHARHYKLNYADAAEIYSVVERILNTRSKTDTTGSLPKAGLLEKSNSILVTGPPSVHRMVEELVNDVDVQMPYEMGLIKVYKIDNADVEEIAQVISDLIEQDNDQADDVENSRYSEQTENSDIIDDTNRYIYKIPPRVTINASTNSVIVQASSRVHRELAELVKQLDTRRKQVLIKAMIVEVLTDDNLDLGIEINHAGSDEIAFTSFGLSEINPASGVRDIIVSPGGTAAVLRPDKIQAIIRALKSDSNARITSAPQILVNDNAVGFTNSIEEEPTTEINTGETVATTSFAGYVEAGTQFMITPHISEEGYLRVEYQITLNSFGTKSADSTVPPPRNTTSIQSQATVPDGSTIVVGGLQSGNEIESVDKVPLLGDLPLIGQAFKNTSKRKSKKTTYLFITPVIMDSEGFEDLKTVSQEALNSVEQGSENDNRR